METQTTSLGKRRWSELGSISTPLQEVRKIVQHFVGRDVSKTSATDTELIEQGMLEFLELKAANLVAMKGTEAKKVAATASCCDPRSAGSESVPLLCRARPRPRRSRSTPPTCRIPATTPRPL